MSPRDKAISLIIHFDKGVPLLRVGQSLQAAKVATDEIIHLLNAVPLFNGAGNPEYDKVWAFWIEVKEELNKIEP